MDSAPRSMQHSSINHSLHSAFDPLSSCANEWSEHHQYRKYEMDNDTSSIRSYSPVNSFKYPYSNAEYCHDYERNSDWECALIYDQQNLPYYEPVLSTSSMHWTGINSISTTSHVFSTNEFREIKAAETNFSSNFYKTKQDNQVPRPEPEVTLTIWQPNENDVLCGRGGGSNNPHIGNVRFRQLIISQQQHYKTLTKKQKMNLAREIVYLIRAVGGRFLARDTKGGGWADIGPLRSLEKTSQALREKQEIISTYTEDELDATKTNVNTAGYFPCDQERDKTITTSLCLDSSAVASISTMKRSHKSRNSRKMKETELPKLVVPPHLEKIYKSSLVRVASEDRGTTKQKAKSIARSTQALSRPASNGRSLTYLQSESHKMSILSNSHRFVNNQVDFLDTDRQPMHLTVGVKATSLSTTTNCKARLTEEGNQEHGSENYSTGEKALKKTHPFAFEQNRDPTDQTQGRFTDIKLEGTLGDIPTCPVGSTRNSPPLTSACYTSSYSVTSPSKLPMVDRVIRAPSSSLSKHLRPTQPPQLGGTNKIPQNRKSLSGNMHEDGLAAFSAAAFLRLDE